MKVYLAGPMTGRFEFNFNSFDRAAKMIRDIGWEVLSPAEMFPDEQKNPKLRGTREYSEYVKASLKLLLEAEVIVLLPGWSASDGAVQEFNIARMCGMLLMYFDPDSMKMPRYL